MGLCVSERSLLSVRTASSCPLHPSGIAGATLCAFYTIITCSSRGYNQGTITCFGEGVKEQEGGREERTRKAGRGNTQGTKPREVVCGPKSPPPPAPVTGPRDTSGPSSRARPVPAAGTDWTEEGTGQSGQSVNDGDTICFSLNDPGATRKPPRGALTLRWSTWGVTLGHDL